jgi:hypothetical protein
MNEVKNLCGLSIAIIGMVLYGHIKEIDNKRANGVDVNDCLEACLPGGVCARAHVSVSVSVSVSMPVGVGACACVCIGVTCVDSRLCTCTHAGAVTDVQLKERIFSEASEASEESKEPGIANQTDK